MRKGESSLRFKDADWMSARKQFRMNRPINQESSSAVNDTAVTAMLPAGTAIPKASVDALSHLEPPHLSSEIIPAINDQRFCNAKTKSGGPFRHKAGKSTSPVGPGRCQYYGGA